MSSPAVAARPSTASVVARWTARVLLGLYGLSLLPAVVYFSFFASVEDGRVTTAGDGLVAVWALAIAAGLLWSAVKLGDGTDRTLLLTRGVVLAHVAFGLVKYFGYEETEAVGFFAFDLLLLALLAVPFRRRTAA